MTPIMGDMTAIRWRVLTRENGLCAPFESDGVPVLRPARTDFVRHAAEMALSPAIATRSYVLNLFQPYLREH